MAVVVSKADALVEMVRAYDNQEVKRSNKIGQVLSKSIQKDNKENIYNEYIGLNKKSKQLFPIKIRRSKKKVNRDNDKPIIEIEIRESIQEIDGETIIVREKRT